MKRILFAVLTMALLVSSVYAVEIEGKYEISADQTKMIGHVYTHRFNYSTTTKATVTGLLAGDAASIESYVKADYHEFDEFYNSLQISNITQNGSYSYQLSDTNTAPGYDCYIEYHTSGDGTVSGTYTVVVSPVLDN